MKRFITFFIPLLILPIVLLAQNNTEDVVYKKDGGILRGEIVEYQEDNFLKIETAGRNLFVVMMDEVEKVTQEEIPGEIHYKKSGYINRSGIETIRSGDQSSLRLYTVNGYQFTPRFSTGIGIGYTPYNDPLLLIPFFVDFTYRILEANASPFIFLKAGYNFSSVSDDNLDVSDNNGGLLFNPGIGLQFNLSNDLGWYINAGYNIDNSSYEIDLWGPQTEQNKLSFRRVNFGIGLSF